MVAKKVDSARTLIAGGWRISLVSRSLRVSREQLHAMARRSKNWQDSRRKRNSDDTEVLKRIHTVIGDLPTYGYRRVWALLLECKPVISPSKRVYTGKVAVGESNQ